MYTVAEVEAHLAKVRGMGIPMCDAAKSVGLLRTGESCAELKARLDANVERYREALDLLAK